MDRNFMNIVLCYLFVGRFIRLVTAVRIQRHEGVISCPEFRVQTHFCCPIK